MSYKIIETKKLKDSEGNEVMCEVRDYENMSKEEVEDMLQEMTIINNDGEEETIDLRYR